MIHFIFRVIVRFLSTFTTNKNLCATKKPKAREALCHNLFSKATIEPLKFVSLLGTHLAIHPGFTKSSSFYNLFDNCQCQKSLLCLN
jgi:hypothetical protein